MQKWHIWMWQMNCWLRPCPEHTRRSQEAEEAAVEGVEAGVEVAR